MHDKKGRELKAGDRVLLPATVVSVSGGEDYCNLDLESTHGRRPDHSKERVSAINTGVVLRANEDDINEDPFEE